jgi:Tfp pilus assembly protein PilF
LPDASSNALSLKEIADRLEHNSNSRPFHLMLAFELRTRAEPVHEKELFTRAIELYGNGDDETLIALGSWLYSHGQFDFLLKVLPLDRAVERRELLMEHIDALAALNRLEEVKEILLTENAVLDPAFQHMYLAVVRSKLGNTTAASNEWQRALESAESPRALIGLADYAEKMGAFEIADAAYARLIQKQPELKSSYLSRFQLAQSLGATEKAHDLAVEIMRLWPEDDATHMRAVYLRLLLDPSEETAKAAESEVAPFVAKNPWDGSARSALALARLRQGKPAAALNTLTEFMPGVPSSAVSASVYAAASAANGWKDRARQEAEKLASENILPEERALIAPLLSEKR